MPQRRFFDQSQPQTLQGAVIFCYLNAALSLLYALILSGSSYLLLVLLLLAPAAYFVANDRKWGYRSAVGLSIVNVVLVLAILIHVHTLSIVLNLLFAALLVYLLLHPLSRSYARIYFR